MLATCADLLAPVPARATGTAPTSDTPAFRAGSPTFPGLLAQAGEEDYRVRRWRKRQARLVGQQENAGDGKRQEPAPRPKPEEPQTASFPGDATVQVRREGWRITAAGGNVEVHVLKGAFPAGA